MNKLIRLIGAMLLLAIPLQAQNPTQGDPNRLLKLENGKLGIQTNGATAGQVPTYNGSAVVWGAGGGGGSGTFIANTNGIGVGTKLTNDVHITSPGHIWMNASSNLLLALDGTWSLDWQDRRMYDDAELDSIRWDTRVLMDSAPDFSLNWETRRLLTAGNVTAADWSVRTLNDTSGGISLDWENRVANDGGANVIDWGGLQLSDSSSVTSVHWENRELYSSSGNLTLEWEQNRLNNDSGQLVIDYGDYELVGPSGVTLNWDTMRLINSGSGFETLDWEGGTARDNSNKIGLDWMDRTLNDSNSGAVVLTWDGGELEGTNLRLNFNTGLSSAGDGTKLWDYTRKLYNSSDVITVDWEAMVLRGDGSHPVIVDWGNYQTRGSADTKSIDWDDRQLFRADGTTQVLDWQTKTLASNWAIPAISNDLRSVTCALDGQGAVISTGVKSDIRVPYNGTLKGWTILADQSGAIVFDVWKDTIANYPPTVADTITAAAKPALSSMAISNNYTLSGWSTSVTTNDTLRFNVDSASTVTRGTLILYIERN